MAGHNDNEVTDFMTTEPVVGARGGDSTPDELGQSSDEEILLARKAAVRVESQRPIVLRQDRLDSCLRACLRVQNEVWSSSEVLVESGTSEWHAPQFQPQALILSHAATLGGIDFPHRGRDDANSTPSPLLPSRVLRCFALPSVRNTGFSLVGRLVDLRRDFNSRL